MAWLIPACFLLAIAALIILRHRKPNPRPLTATEYWVYLPEATMPTMERIMDAMLAANPHNRPGQPCITKREGILFTDIRLHLAMLRREKNAHAFRPDLLFDCCRFEAASLSLLGKAQGIAKLSYISEAPLPDRRHLQFMPHLASAVSRLGGGLAVFDVQDETLWTSTDYEESLQETPLQENQNQVRIAWVPDAGGSFSRSLGLKKIGLHELRSDAIPSDEVTAIEPVLEEVAQRMWSGDLAPEYEVERLGQRFLVTVSPLRGEVKVTIARVTAR